MKAHQPRPNEEGLCGCCGQESCACSVMGVAHPGGRCLSHCPTCQRNLSNYEDRGRLFDDPISYNYPD